LSIHLLETDERKFQDAVEGLRSGDFSRLASLFDGDPCRIVNWHREGDFDGEPQALDEAFACACFVGRTGVAACLLDHGVDPVAGDGTGMCGFHWAVNRGNSGTVELLLERKAPLETRNMYGGTVLGTAVWSAINERKDGHLAIIETLIRAGANLDAVKIPVGNNEIEEMFRRHGAS
jgi:ankyrin repeat protein